MIRNYERKDLDAVMGIWLNTNTQAHDFIPASYWARNMALVRNRYIPESNTFIYEKDDQIQGFISVLNDSYIGALFVAPEFQHQGIGTALLDYVKKNCDSLSLKVFAKNKKAVSFYDAHGFGIDEKQEDPETGELEFLMSWKSDSWLELLHSITC